jgi:signal transduction histidine kinase
MQKVTDNIFLLVLFAMVGTFILAASFIFFFLRYQRKIALQKAAMQKAEVEYSTQLLNATLLSQEEERKRIGRDLHDDVGASLSNLKMIMAQTVETDEAKTKYKPLIDNIITTVRTISHTLSPPGLELFGFEYAVQELVDSFNVAGTIKVELKNSVGTKLDALSKSTALALYRVLQELFSNTIKHANAKNIWATFLEENEQIVFIYVDDGKGMAVEDGTSAGMGMKNIEARLKMINATHTIISSPNNGFKLTINVQYNK